MAYGVCRRALKKKQSAPKKNEQESAKKLAGAPLKYREAWLKQIYTARSDGKP